MRALLAALLCAVAAGVADPARAQLPPTPDTAAGTEYRPPTMPAAPSPGGLLARLVLFGGGCLALLGLALWLTRRQSHGPDPGQSPGPSPHVVASVWLAGRCALHLLQVEQAGFVVATDASGIKAIQPLPEPFEPLLDASLQEPPGPPDCPLAPRRVVGEET